MLPPQAKALICVSTIFPPLAIVAVGLRVYARRLLGTKLNSSDYTIFFTLFTSILNAAACIIGAVACGVGLPLSDLTPQLQVRFLKFLFALQFFYVFSVWGVKVSVVLFYKNLFTSSGFQRTSNAVLLFLGAWIVALFFATLFQDDPIARNWGAPGTTINWPIFYISTCAIDLALDIFILCMPLPVIRRLHTSAKKKWALACVLWLGSFVVIATVVRLWYLVLIGQDYVHLKEDFSYMTVNNVIWGSLEPYVSIIAACLPLITPLLFKKRRLRGNTGYGAYSYGRQTGSDRSGYPLQESIVRDTESRGKLTGFDTAIDRSPATSVTLCGNSDDKPLDIEIQIPTPNVIHIRRDLVMDEERGIA